MLGHPLHAPTTHVPLGTLASAALWDVLAMWTGNSIYWAVAFHVMWLGLLAAVPTVATGLLELRRLGRVNDAHASLAVRHGLVMAVALGAYAISVIARAGVAPPVGLDRVVAVGAELGGLVTLVIGGALGGSMVYVHGIATRTETPTTLPNERHTSERETPPREESGAA